MNSNAKSLYDAVATTLVELDSEGHAVTGSVTVNWASGTCDRNTDNFDTKISNYFDGVADLASASASIDDGACTATFCSDGNYNGGYPVGSTVDNYTTFTLADAAR